jgi:transposase
MSQRKRSPAQANSSSGKPAKASRPPKPASRPPREQAVALAVVNANAAGIDVHSDMHMVCVPLDRASPQAEGELAGLPENVRKFGANSCDLAAIADWLAGCGVTTVAMESTGVYWIPLFELLEARGFEVYLVEPGQLAHCGARPKTDVLDVQWIQRLHT